MLDLYLTFDQTPKNLAAGVADQLSTDVLDEGTTPLKKLFEGFAPLPPKFCVTYKITAGTGVLSFRARLVAADNAALTTNPIILADTGVQTRKQTSDAVLAIGDQLIFEIPVTGQYVAKQFYGAIYTKGTADQDGEVTCYVGGAIQSQMPARKAAVP